MAKKPEETQGATDNQEIQAQTGSGLDTGADTAKADTTAAVADENAKAPETGNGGDEGAARASEAAAAQPALESLSALAERHRVTSWQQAALMRCMGWENGKLVTDDEYRAALIRIKNRPMGGGRLA